MYTSQVLESHNALNIMVHYQHLVNHFICTPLPIKVIYIVAFEVLQMHIVASKVTAKCGKYTVLIMIEDWKSNMTNYHMKCF